MPQSSTALRHKAEALRVLRNPTQSIKPDFFKPGMVLRPVWARRPFPVARGALVALEVRRDGAWVLVKAPDGTEAWSPAQAFPGDVRHQWARTGF